MQTYLVTLGKGLAGPSRMNGALVLGEKCLYFLCASLGVAGGYNFGAFGSIGAALEDCKKTGGQPVFDEAELGSLVSSTPHSFVIPCTQVELLSRSFCAGSKITHDGGKKLVVWNPGFAGKFRDEAKQWAAKNGVRSEGL